jgi:arylsulfatase A-like enzyme
VAAGSTNENLVLNTDYLPTFMELAEEQTPPYVDGRSLVPILRGPAPTSWRTAILIEGRKNSADPEIVLDRNYNGIRTSTRKYIEYESLSGSGSIRELYDLSADPNELTNTYSSANPDVPPLSDLRAQLNALKGCHPDDLATPENESCQTAEDGP